MIVKDASIGKGLSLRSKAQILDINRSSVYYQPQPIGGEMVSLMNEIQDLYAQYPFMGYRRITVMLKNQGYEINRKRVLRLMQFLGLQALYPKKNLSKRRQKDAVFPYLLKETPPQKPNDAWKVDITYIKLLQGFVYLVALIDVFSRKIMGWCLSPFLETHGCIEAFEMGVAIAIPMIVNSDQVAPCKRIEDSSLRWLPWQSIASSQVPSLAWYVVTPTAKRRQGNNRPESKGEEDN